MNIEVHKSEVKIKPLYHDCRLQIRAVRDYKSQWPMGTRGHSWDIGNFEIIIMKIVSDIFFKIFFCDS